jgi:hypothetical protein
MSMQAVRDAAERLAQRLSLRAGQTADLSVCSPAVPAWWREDMADYRIFGDGLLSLEPGPGPGHERAFSRPVDLFSAAEISAHAGAEYVPLAWADGATNVILVHDRGQLPVFISPIGGATAGALVGQPLGEPWGDTLAEPLADSLVAFLDALRPRTLCDFIGPDERRRIELIGERTLLVGHGGHMEEHTFSDDDDVGAVMAGFLSDAVNAGLRVVSCPAEMRPMIAEFAGTLARGRQPAPEERARTAILALCARGELEFSADDIDLDEFIDQASRWLERHGQGWGKDGRPPLELVRKFGEWLIEQPAVEEVFADDEALAEAFVRPTPTSIPGG